MTKKNDRAEWLKDIIGKMTGKNDWENMTGKNDRNEWLGRMTGKAC